VRERRKVMNAVAESKEEKLARLKSELKELKATMPEHCYGTKGYVCTHHATPKHWELLEATEEEIETIEAELGLK
jgi:hypothetical protein